MALIEEVELSAITTRKDSSVGVLVFLNGQGVEGAIVRREEVGFFPAIGKRLGNFTKTLE